GCPPLVVRFKNLSTGATSYNWDFGFSGPGGSSTSTDTVVSTVYYNPGKYTVKLTASNGSQSDDEEKTFYITVRDTPTVDFTGTPTSGCAPLSVNFTSSVTLGGSSGTYS